MINNIQELGLNLIEKNLSEKCYISFKDRWADFYIDCNGQRLHYIVPYQKYSDIGSIKDHYVVRRNLSFTNKIDEGKQDAILLVIDLSKCKVISISEESVEFESFTFHLKGNNYISEDRYNRKLINV